MAEVTLHVYDVTNSQNVRANSAILNLNKIMRGGIGLGGIFHGGVEVYNKEWSFGYCEEGSGVFSCQPKQNPMYTYRETVSLGRTALTRSRVDAVLQLLSQEWQGNSYDLLSRNCNHFCDALCEKLLVQKPPLWVNRFANAGDAAIEAAETTMIRLREAKENVLSASSRAMQFMFGSAASPSPSLDSAAPESPSNSNGISSLMESTSRLFARGSPSLFDNGSSGRDSRQEGGSPEPAVIYLPWKEPASDLPP